MFRVNNIVVGAINCPKVWESCKICFYHGELQDSCKLFNHAKPMDMSWNKINYYINHSVKRAEVAGDSRFFCRRDLFMFGVCKIDDPLLVSSRAYDSTST